LRLSGEDSFEQGYSGDRTGPLGVAACPMPGAAGKRFSTFSPDKRAAFGGSAGSGPRAVSQAVEREDEVPVANAQLAAAAGAGADSDLLPDEPDFSDELDDSPPAAALSPPPDEPFPDGNRLSVR